MRNMLGYCPSSSPEQFVEMVNLVPSGAMRAFDGATSNSRSESTLASAWTGTEALNTRSKLYSSHGIVTAQSGCTAPLAYATGNDSSVDVATISFRNPPHSFVHFSGAGTCHMVKEKVNSHTAVPARKHSYSNAKDSGVALTFRSRTASPSTSRHLTVAFGDWSASAIDSASYLTWRMLCSATLS